MGHRLVQEEGDQQAEELLGPAWQVPQQLLLDIGSQRLSHQPEGHQHGHHKSPS
jgi:hypothetical protein